MCTYSSFWPKWSLNCDQIFCKKEKKNKSQCHINHSFALHQNHPDYCALRATNFAGQTEIFQRIEKLKSVLKFLKYRNTCQSLKTFQGIQNFTDYMEKFQRVSKVFRVLRNFQSIQKLYGTFQNIWTLVRVSKLTRESRILKIIQKLFRLSGNFSLCPVFFSECQKKFQSV